MGLSCADFAERCDLPLELIRVIVAGEAPIELPLAVILDSESSGTI